MLFKSVEHPITTAAPIIALVLTTGRTHRRMRIPADLDQATEIAGRPLQPISRFQQISANLRATATRAFFAPERLRIRW